ncbi:hypothetical protein LFYK43_14060 [Ligilactobacillus salitolerans]|uniref:Uncharacterized protein n=1 Tax=Ligilactobacillus salitolerans TaxID=1808352 RepID=A0A401ITX5_9LACO|nr:hypothetical protein [Ligilactobacillus salitolerans]GBG94947.1 hypothetical protein LFYK43_14060 [Ligilactobacillus salitolerans]
MTNVLKINDGEKLRVDLEQNLAFLVSADSKDELGEITEIDNGLFEYMDYHNGELVQLRASSRGELLSRLQKLVHESR